MTGVHRVVFSHTWWPPFCFELTIPKGVFPSFVDDLYITIQIFHVNQFYYDFSLVCVLRSYNINKLAEQAVEEVLKIGVCKTFLFWNHYPISLINIVYFSSGKSQTGLDVPLYRDFIEKGELFVFL